MSVLITGLTIHFDSWPCFLHLKSWNETNTLFCSFIWRHLIRIDHPPSSFYALYHLTLLKWSPFVMTNIIDYPVTSETSSSHSATASDIAPGNFKQQNIFKICNTCWLFFIYFFIFFYLMTEKFNKTLLAGNLWSKS